MHMVTYQIAEDHRKYAVSALSTVPYTNIGTLGKYE